MVSEIEQLKSEIEKLKLEKQELIKKYEPSLSTRISISKLMHNSDKFVGRTIGVAGWVRTSRSGGGGSFCFVKLYDGTSALELQIVVDSTIPGFSGVSQGAAGTSIFALGEIVASKGKEQKIEMAAKEIRILGTCDAAKYPLSGKGLSLEHLRRVAHLRPRSIVLGAVFRVRNALAYATHNFFQQRNYMYVHTPLITASDCEGGGEMFQVTTLIDEDKFKKTAPDGKADFSGDFFKKPAFLTVSGQLNVECYATAFSNVYTFGPTFRAEDSHTTRHLSEFWMIEPEIAFAEINENMDIAEAYIKHLIHEVLERCPADFKILEAFEKKNNAVRKKNQAKEEKLKKQRLAEKFKKLKAEGKLPPAKKKQKKQKGPKKQWRDRPLIERLNLIVNSQFARVTYTEAIALLEKAVEEGHQFEEDVKWGMDMSAEHEKYLCEVHFQKATIVRDYPKDIKAFYMKLNDDGKTVAAMDILVPGIGELVGGSQREHRLDHLLKRLEEMGLSEEDYHWYMELRRYGTVPHSGFGLGFERMVCYTTAIDNIRDVIPFPRYPGHADF